MSLLKRINRVHFQTGQRIAGECVSVRRGGKTFTALAVRGHSTLQDTAANGDGVIEITSVDFQFLACDYDFGGGPVEPRRGDKITADGDLFDLLPGSAGENWRYMDHDQTTLRIHTVRRVTS